MFKKLESRQSKHSYPAGTVESDDGWYVLKRMCFIEKLEDNILTQTVAGRVVAGPYEFQTEAEGELKIFMWESDE